MSVENIQYTNGKEPLISVIVPVYNTASLLPRCVESILNQTHKNLELILVNDGSTDGSGDVCDEYAKKDARVRVIHQKNAGNSGAINTGLDVMTGQWFAIADSDDYIDLQMYAKLLCAATLQKTLLSACGYAIKLRTGLDKLIVFPNCPPKITAIECIEWRSKGLNLSRHWAMLYHRKLINKPMGEGTGDRKDMDGKTLPLQFDAAIHIGQDRLFLVEALLRAEKLAYIPEALYVYDCTRADSLTNSPFSEKNITWLIGRKKVIELLEPILPKFALQRRRRLAFRAFSFMRKTLLSEDVFLNALYPECRRVAKGYMRYLLTYKEVKLKNKIVGCIVYLFPHFARAAWKFLNSLKRKEIRPKTEERVRD